METRAGTTRFATRGNARLAYEVSKLPSGAPVVVMLHALLADRGTLAGLRDDLVANYRVILPDARGHGASASLADQRRTIADASADVVAILDAEAISAAHLVGHGLGGATALELARRHPARALSLTLIEPDLPGVLANDPRPSARAARDQQQTVERAAADVAYKGLIDNALATLLDERWGAGWRERLSRPRLAAIRRNAGALAGTLPALDSYGVARQDVAQLTQPVLIVHGLTALAIYPLIAERLAAWLPTARVAKVPPAADPAFPLTGEPAEQLSQLLRDFLANAAASS